MEYVRTCPNAPVGGTGFFVIPGTETCLRISGYVRAEYRFQQNSEAWSVGTARQIDRAQSDINFFARGSIAFDARTPTGHGLLRSFIRINANSGDSGFFTNNGNTVAAPGFDDGAVLDQAFVQYYGLTAGRITSFFDYQTGGLLTGVETGSDTTTEVLAYSASLGPVTASISVENGERRRVDTTGNGFDYGGQNLPDLVGAIFLEQSWGHAQISGALHQVRHDGDAAIVGGDETGWAVGGGITFNLPMLAANDQLFFKATYADGAMSYLGGQGVSFFEETSVLMADAYRNAITGELETSKGYVLAAGMTHFWTPNVSSVFRAAYGAYDAPNNGVGVAAPGTVVTSQTGTHQDFTYWQLGSSLNWRPVTQLLIAADAVYTQVDFDNPTRNARMPAGATVSTDSIWAGRLRIQRDF